MRLPNSAVLRILSDTWEQWAAGRALLLTNEPKTVLDLPCGDGRFWPLLARQPDRRIIAADPSSTALINAWNTHPAQVILRVSLLPLSASAIGLKDQSVDCIFSMHPFRRVNNSAARIHLLREFHRITREYLIISIDTGAPRAWWPGQSRAVQERAIASNAYRRQLESEFRAAGFTLQRSIIRFPLLSVNRVYVLQKHGPT